MATTRVPADREAHAIARRFEKHGSAYFRFLITPGDKTTHNVAELALRFVVIDGQITRGSRGVKGQPWCESIWTILATCAQQDCSAKEFRIQTAAAWVQGQPPSISAADHCTDKAATWIQGRSRPRIRSST